MPKRRKKKFKTLVTHSVDMHLVEFLEREADEQDTTKSGVINKYLTSLSSSFAKKDQQISPEERSSEKDK